MQKIRPEDHDLVGGDVCLDFVNTKGGYHGTILHEVFFSYRELPLWGCHAGILTEEETNALLWEANANPAGAKRAFQKAMELREVIFRVFSTAAAGKTPDTKDLAQLNALRVEALKNSHLIRQGNRFISHFKDEVALDRVTWTITLSAVELLTSEAVERLKECDGHQCVWLFIDNSRNQRRRWCSMEECGNRAKMRRRYARNKKKTA